MKFKTETNKSGIRLIHTPSGTSVKIRPERFGFSVDTVRVLYPDYSSGIEECFHRLHRHCFRSLPDKHQKIFDEHGTLPIRLRVWYFSKIKQQIGYALAKPMKEHIKSKITEDDLVLARKYYSVAGFGSNRRPYEKYNTLFRLCNSYDKETLLNHNIYFYVSKICASQQRKTLELLLKHGKTNLPHRLPVYVLEQLPYIAKYDLSGRTKAIIIAILSYSSIYKGYLQQLDKLKNKTIINRLKSIYKSVMGASCKIDFRKTEHIALPLQYITSLWFNRCKILHPDFFTCILQRMVLHETSNRMLLRRYS